MGIGGTKGIDSMPGRPMDEAQPIDSVIKGIREEISEARRQRQELSSKEDLPAAEKVKKRQELQQKISDLNRQLRQRQAEVRKEQQKAALAKESRNDASGVRDTDEKKAKAKDPAQKFPSGENQKAGSIKADNAKATAAKPNKAQDTGIQKEDAHNAGASVGKADGRASQNNAVQDKIEKLQDFEIPKKEWKAVVKSDSSREQARKQESVIARIEGGIAILKSEIKLDEARGADVEKKQEELRKQNEKLQKASSAQFFSPGQFNRAVEKAAPAKTGTAPAPSIENGQTTQQQFKDIAVSLTI